MRSSRCLILVLLVGLILPAHGFQSKAAPCDAGATPNVVRFAGTLLDAVDHPRTGPTALRFSLYSVQFGGAPLWQETVSVVPNSAGRYEVLLGCSNGADFVSHFTANAARWLGIQVLADAEPEQPRVMLVSVPYALKAQDADTLGGLPASAFLRANAGTGGLTSASGSRKSSGQAAALELEGTVSADPHTTNAIPKFTSTTDTLADSMMFELYDQVAVDAVGHGLANEDVVKLGDGTGRKKRFEVDGRLVGQGFDMVTSLPNAVHAVSTYVDGVGMQANADGIGFSSGITGTSRGLNGAGVVGFALPPLSLQPQAPGDYALGVLATNYHPQGAALEAFNAYDGTALGADFPVVSGNIGVYSGTAHSSAIPLVLEQLASSGQILSARAQGTEVASMNSAGDFTTSGSITATSFSGSGAGLSNVNATSLNGQAAASYALASDLTAETSARSSADTTLQANIDSANSAIAAEATARSTADAKLAVRGITYLAGCDSCNLLTLSDNQKAFYVNVVGAMTLNQVTCISDAGSPTINIQRDDGSASDILSPDLACSTGNGTTSAVAGGEATFSLGEKLDFYIRSGTGSAHRVTIIVKATLN